MKFIYDIIRASAISCWTIVYFCLCILENFDFITFIFLNLTCKYIRILLYTSFKNDDLNCKPIFANWTDITVESLFVYSIWLITVNIWNKKICFHTAGCIYFREKLTKINIMIKCKQEHAQMYILSSKRTINSLIINLSIR